MSMRKESGETASDKEEILIYAQISAYQTITSQCPQQKVQWNQVQTQKIIPKFTAEVERATERMKKNTKPMEWMELQVI